MADAVEMLYHINQQMMVSCNELTEWQVLFIESLLDNPPENFSAKQLEVIELLFWRLCRPTYYS